MIQVQARKDTADYVCIYSVNINYADVCSFINDQSQIYIQSIKYRLTKAQRPCKHPLCICMYIYLLSITDIYPMMRIQAHKGTATMLPPLAAAP